MPKVLLTRPVQRTNEDDSFSNLLKAEKIEVIKIPMIRIDYPSSTQNLDRAFEQLANNTFDYCVLSSPTAIEYFHQKALDLGLNKQISKSVGLRQ